MPRLLQKFVNQWVNVNKEHVVYRENTTTTTNNITYNKRSKSPKRKKNDNHYRDKISNINSDDSLTVETVSTNCNSVTSSNSNSSSVHIDFKNWADYKSDDDSFNSGRNHHNMVNHHNHRRHYHHRRWSPHIVPPHAEQLQHTKHQKEHLVASPKRISSGSNNHEHNNPAHSNELNVQDLTFLQRVKQGSFGTVYRGNFRQKQLTGSLRSNSMMDSSSTRTMAVSIQVMSTNCPRSKWIEEINILRPLSRHPNLVTLYGWSNLSSTYGGSEIAGCGNNREQKQQSNIFCLVTQPLSSACLTPSSNQLPPRHQTSRSLGSLAEFTTKQQQQQQFSAEVLLSVQPLDVWLSRSHLRHSSHFWHILKEISCGLAHLHHHKIMHGFLQPNNVMVYHHQVISSPNDLINSDNESIASNSRKTTNRIQVKLADFGLWNIMNQHYMVEDAEDDCDYFYESNNTGPMMTMMMKRTMSSRTQRQRCSRYTAPEIISSSSASNIGKNVKADIYSFGMLTWHLLTHQTPFRNVQDQFQVMEMISSQHHDSVNRHCINNRPPFPVGTPEQLRTFIECCWSDAVDDRFSSKDVHHHILSDLESQLKEEHRTWLNDPRGHSVYDDSNNNILLKGIVHSPIQQPINVISPPPPPHPQKDTLADKEDMLTPSSKGHESASTNNSLVDQHIEMSNKKMSELTVQDRCASKFCSRIRRKSMTADDVNKIAREYAKRSMDVDDVSFLPTNSPTSTRLKRAKVAASTFCDVNAEEVGPLFLPFFPGGKEEVRQSNSSRTKVFKHVTHYNHFACSLSSPSYDPVVSVVDNSCDVNSSTICGPNSAVVSENEGDSISCQNIQAYNKSSSSSQNASNSIDLPEKGAENSGSVGLIASLSNTEDKARLDALEVLLQLKDQELDDKALRNLATKI